MRACGDGFLVWSGLMEIGVASRDGCFTSCGGSAGSGWLAGAEAVETSCDAFNQVGCLWRAPARLAAACPASDSSSVTGTSCPALPASFSLESQGVNPDSHE